MENGTRTVNPRLHILQRLLPAVVPVLLIAISYVDPGKWVTAVEGGARFGFDLVAPMLVFSFAAILCHYLSASIAVVTGRDLAQICSEEYDKATCIFLGVQTELSMILFDLNMILGSAHALNLIFGVDLFTCVFLTSVHAFLFPLFSAVVESAKGKVLCICMTSFILICYVCGVLISQPEIPISTSGMLTKLSGETAFVLMSLLGATIMPHNLYLHSSIVQQDMGPSNVSKGALCHDHFFATLCIFSGIFLVNYALMNSAANVFHSTGLVLLTFQDVLSLMDQVFRIPLGPFAFLLVLFFSNQITALTWNLGREAVLRDFFGMDIPGWLHHATIRIIAVVPALYCVWNSGAEGIYQLLIYTQVMVALVLPSSVIPLFRVAMSRSIMGVYKVSVYVEFLALITFIGMLGLEVIFLVEMIFGNSDWVGNLRWSMGSNTSFPYSVLLITASASLCLVLWLAATPLKSASSRLNIQNTVPEPYVESDYSEIRYREERESELSFGNSLQRQLGTSVTSGDLNLPETLLDSDSVLHLTTIEESCSNVTPPIAEMVDVSTVCEAVSDGDSLDNSALRTESTDIVEKTERVEGDSPTEKRDEVYIWEHEELSKGVSGISPSLTSDGPGSFRSLSVKSDDAGSGAGSLSRLAGLGRSARRQLAVVLDEFWGQLYDFHGHATQEAKAKKLDLLLGAETKVDSAISSSLYDSPMKHELQRGVASSHGVQRGSGAFWSNQGQSFQNSSLNPLDSGERRYSSLRLPSTSDGYDYQPVTVHGYQIASYVSRTATEKHTDFLNGQNESLAPNSPSFGTSNYRDPLGYALARKLPNKLSPETPPGFPTRAVSRKSSLQSEGPFYDLSSSGLVESLDPASNAKKFYSLPDISGLLPKRDSYLSDRSAQWDSRHSPIGCGPSLYSRPSFSPKVSGDPLSLPFGSDSGTGSIWSRQPFEQFGVADKSRGSGQSSLTEETTISVDSEAKLLQSFRHCIVKLLKLEGSDWLFSQNDGADEDLIERVAARERFLYEAESRETNLVARTGEFSYFSDRSPGFVSKMDDTDYTKSLISSVPHCGEGCVWRVDLIISFGVWCIHRVLVLSLMESRPELWGKYTYVLNRLQGIIDLAFSKPRTPMAPCFCLQLPATHQQRSSPLKSNGSLPPPVQQNRGKCTTAPLLLDIIKDVEIALSCRKGKTGTAAGDVAFPKGKENLASVLKRYKRRLSNKPNSTQEVGSVSRKVHSAHYGS